MRLFSVVIVAALLCFVTTVLGVESPKLTLWTESEFISGQIEVKVHRQNDGFGLGGLAYSMNFSESLNVIREYSDYGWVTKDGIFDLCDPADGENALNISTLHFDTVVEPPAAEFASGSTGIVETIRLTPTDIATPRWIYFDLGNAFASNGSGDDLKVSLGGSVDLLLNTNLPESHMAGIYIPEPITLLLFGCGGMMLLRKRSAASPR
jgi:hypothetical protein